MIQYNAIKEEQSAGLTYLSFHSQ